MKRVLIVLIGFVLLLVGCGGAATTTTLAATTPAPAVTTTTAAPTTTTLAPSTTTTAEATTTTTAVLSKKWGTTVEVNGLRITVRVPASDKNTYVETNGKRDNTSKVIVSEVVLENIGSTPQIYDAADFTLYDTSDSSYTGDSEESAVVPGKPALRSGYLQPGKKVYRYLRYIVPADAAARRIEYDVYDLTSGSLTESVIWEY